LRGGKKIAKGLLSNHQQTEKAAFGEMGKVWRPRVKHVVITAGEMIIMPSAALVIHGPLTLEDCLMKGGMYLDAHQCIAFIDHLIRLARFPHLTNEPIQRELVRAWHHLEKLVTEDPSYFGEGFDVGLFEVKS